MDKSGEGPLTTFVKTGKWEYSFNVSAEHIDPRRFPLICRSIGTAVFRKKPRPARFDIKPIESIRASSPAFSQRPIMESFYKFRRARRMHDFRTCLRRIAIFRPISKRIHGSMNPIQRIVFILDRRRAGTTNPVRFPEGDNPSHRIPQDD